ncbi:MAG TPA: mercuric reductase [Stellaceae bacterium]|jgi:mercuric ion transport protein|nr:mercuric reductase [Stellaceae bacterium]
MTENTHSDAPRRGIGSDTGVMLLAAGGLAAAFGVASCCALPILLGALGVGSAWLIAVAWLAAPHRLALLTVAVVCLVGGGGLLLWRRRAAAMCAPGAACGRPVITGLLTAALSLGAVLTVLGFLYA